MAEPRCLAETLAWTQLLYLPVTDHEYGRARWYWQPMQSRSGKVQSPTHCYPACTRVYTPAKRSAVSQPCICRSGARPRPETLPVLRCSNLRVEIVLGPGDPDVWFVALELQRTIRQEATSPSPFGMRMRSISIRDSRSACRYWQRSSVCADAVFASLGLSTRAHTVSTVTLCASRHDMPYLSGDMLSIRTRQAHDQLGQWYKNNCGYQITYNQRT